MGERDRFSLEQRAHYPASRKQGRDESSAGGHFMADFRIIPGQPGVHYVASTFVVSRNTSVDIALWGGGPNGEALVVVALNPDLIEVYDLTYVSAPLGAHLRRIQLKAKGYGQTTLQARLGPSGPVWAEAAVAVEGTVIAQGAMVSAHDAPISGSIPVAIGVASKIRIPVSGTNGLAIELTPRGWTPKGGSTSTLFIQDITGKRHLRLDYGYNKVTKTVDYHWNQEGTFPEFGIKTHTPAGAGGEALYSGAKYFRYGGRVLLVAGAAIDIYSIVVSNKPLRKATQVAAGWVGAWGGCKAFGMGGAYVGTVLEPGLGTAIGGIVGCVSGGFIGYEGFSAGAARVYDWAEGTIFTPVPVSDTP